MNRFLRSLLLVPALAGVAILAGCSSSEAGVSAESPAPPQPAGAANAASAASHMSPEAQAAANGGVPPIVAGSGRR